MLTLSLLQNFAITNVSSFRFPDYADCHHAMRRCNLTFSPSEAHAIAVGLLAGDVSEPGRHWAAVMYADLQAGDALADECRSCLDRLYHAAGEQMQDRDFGLHLFLPPSDFAEQGVSMAIRDWAQGFLFGFGLAGKEAASARLSEEGSEALRDFYEIGNLDVSDETNDEEQQQALSEIEEYLRVAAMLIYEDMHARQPTGEASYEIH